MIFYSRIKLHTSSRLNKLKILPNYFSFRAEGVEKENLISKYIWNTSNLKINKATISNNSEGLLVKINNNYSPFYFTLNSKVKNFKSINFNQGISTAELDSLDIGLHISKEINELRASLLIMEYDKCLHRTNILRYNKNIIHTYTPEKTVDIFVICIEIKGKGKLLIEGMTLRSNSLQYRKVNNTPTNPHFTSADNFSSFDKIKIYLDKVDQDNSDILRQVYLWKRRALQWEEKAKTNSSSSQLNHISIQALLQLAKHLPKSNGCHYYGKLPYKVGIITDIYMFNFYKDTFKDIFYLSPDNYQSILINNDLDIILYVTSWKGITNEEWRGIKFRDKPAKALDEICKYGREKNCKLVFQTIEDPSNYDYFLPIAEKFDYIFTSDSDMISRYKMHLDHENVFYGEYGFNPLLNNPIASQRELINAAFFAGSYPQRYKERCNDMEIIFNSILKSGGDLIIADRNHGDKILRFPDKYLNHIIPPIGHELLQSVHKLFRFNLNFNSIKNSPSMCAMRIYELQAQGTTLISNYAKSVFNNFPNIRIIPTKEDMKYDLNIENKLKEYKLAIDSVRVVMETKTSFEITRNMLISIGLEKNQFPKRTIAVICNKHDRKSKCNFNEQDYINKILIDDDKILDESYWKLMQKNHNIDYFTWFNPKYNYRKHYLGDMVNGFKYTNSSYITKNSYFHNNTLHDGLQHEFTSHILGKDKTLFRADIFTPIFFQKYKIDGEIKDIHNGYSIDPFELYLSDDVKNYVVTKKSNENIKYQLSIIIPTYNNARFLLNKCVPSLQRNKSWEQFEILLIDDGSTDTVTREECRNLESSFENVITYFFPKGGSGSASRPRNKGIELSSAKLITFLDPDNEISPGGYDALIKLYNDEKEKGINLQFVSGYNMKITSQVKPIAKHTSESIAIINNFREHFFTKGKFPTIATQAAVITRSMLLNNPDLRFIEGAAGQDTLFGWELLLESRIGAFTSDAFLIYYADRSDSVTNTLNTEYFKKKYVLEKEQVRILKKHDLIDSYTKNHFDRFMTDWYLPKLQGTLKRDQFDSLNILRKICELYGKDVDYYIKESK